MSSNNSSNNNSINNRLLVYVRVKPVVDERSIIDVVDDTTLVFDRPIPEDRREDPYTHHGKQYNSFGVRKNKNTTYTFDGVFNRDAENLDIFEQVTRPMVDAALNGYNCSVFAYGATGSGKTYTMLGKRGNPGVIYHTTKDLYEKLSVISDKDPQPAGLKICYFEIYNERVHDLLTSPEACRARPNNLPVCEAPGGGQSLVIPDLTYHTPENAEQLIELLEAGNANRSQHPTDANADSSRSHAIFQIVITRRKEQHNGVQISKMSLIDLAGSERASVAYRAGNDRSKNLQREGGNINKSLLALGVCITALASQRGGYIPFRNSMLTRLLRDSLGGKCRTAMIATVCQQQSHYEDTQNTLIYASRAMSISLAEDEPIEVSQRCTSTNLEAFKSELEFQIRNEVALEFRREMEKIREEYKKLIGALKHEKETLANENETLTNEKRALANEKESLANEKESLANENESLASEKETLASEKEALASELEALANEKKVLIDEKEALASENQTLASEKRVLADSKEALARENGALANENKVLTNEKEVLSKDLADMKQLFYRRGEEIESERLDLRRSIEEKETELRSLREKLDKCSCMNIDEPLAEVHTEKKIKRATTIRKQVPIREEEVNDYANMTFDNDDEIIQVSAKKTRQKIPTGKAARKELTMSGRKKRLRSTEDEDVSLSPISPPVRLTRTRTGATRRKLY